MSSPYRQRVVQGGESQVVSYGPFPGRWLPVLGFGLGLFVAWLTSWIGWNHSVLRCQRGPDICTYQRSTLGKTRPIHFALSELKGVRVERFKSNNSSTNDGQVQLDLGTRKLFFIRTSVAEAESTATELRTRLQEGVPAFEVWQRGRRWIGVLGIVLFVLDFALLSVTLRGAGRFVFHVQGSLIRWTRRILGVPVSRGETSVAGARDVFVKWSKRSFFLQPNNAPPENYGQLCWVGQDGVSEPIGPKAFRGHAIHLDAARQLRSALELAPRTERTEREQTLLADATRPPETPSEWNGRSGRFSAGFFGMCCGSLAGLVLLVVVKVGLGLSYIDDSFSDRDFLIGSVGGALGGMILALLLTREKKKR